MPAGPHGALSACPDLTVQLRERIGETPLSQIPSLNSWLRNRQDGEFGPSTVHFYGVFDESVVLVSMNSDVSDSWEREGDNLDYFHTYGGKGYALGVDVAVYMMTH